MFFKLLKLIGYIFFGLAGLALIPTALFLLITIVAFLLNGEDGLKGSGTLVMFFLISVSLFLVGVLLFLPEFIKNKSKFKKFALITGFVHNQAMKVGDYYLFFDFSKDLGVYRNHMNEFGCFYLKDITKWQGETKSKTAEYTGPSGIPHVNVKRFGILTIRFSNPQKPFLQFKFPASNYDSVHSTFSAIMETYSEYRKNNAVTRYEYEKALNELNKFSIKQSAIELISFSVVALVLYISLSSVSFVKQNSPILLNEKIFVDEIYFYGKDYIQEFYKHLMK
ncbi:hypothetical protein [Hydrogenovibrio kuenenii]|uniref:hypothetical protein n=1 Tax=Hydrogenovibrio kuenenii TaxID=63658 RepID=UPI000465EEC8|nr:hypothetical protein [Hydrogenovibrio kuenenii]